MVTRQARDLSIHGLFSCLFMTFQDKGDEWAPEREPAVTQESLQSFPGSAPPTCSSLFYLDGF